jgi:hypothetical protein
MKLISHPIDRPEDRPSQRVKVRSRARFSSIKSLLITSLLFSAYCIGTNDAAFASRCKDVKIILRNNSSSLVKITKFEYFDFDKNKFRTEILQGLLTLMFGPTFSALSGGSGDIAITIDAGKSVGEKENLAYVGNQKTLFKVTYQKRNAGDNSFGSLITQKSESFICRDDSTHTVDLN